MEERVKKIMAEILGIEQESISSETTLLRNGIHLNICSFISPGGRNLSSYSRRIYR